VAALVVILVLATYSGSGNSAAEPAALQAPVSHLTTLASQYETMAAAANKQLAADNNNFTASENGNLAAAKSALLAEVTVARSFDSTLASWLSDWKQTYAAAQAAQAQAPSTTTIPYPSSVATAAQAMIQADQAREAVLVRQASSVSLGQLQSFNGQDRTTGAAVETQVATLRKALKLPAH